MVPMALWLNKEGYENVKLRITSQVSQEFLKEILSNHFNKKIDTSHKLFSLIMLSRYLKN